MAHREIGIKVLERVKELESSYPIKIITKPVLPMLMWNMTIPRYKAIYIFKDTAREARRLGIKIGPTTDENELVKILDYVNPDNEGGKITLICRMGADKIDNHLPKIVKKIKSEGRVVI